MSHESTDGGEPESTFSRLYNVMANDRAEEYLIQAAFVARWRRKPSEREHPEQIASALEAAFAAILSEWNRDPEKLISTF